MSMEERISELEAQLAAINDTMQKGQLSEPPSDDDDGQPQSAYGMYLGLCVDTLDIYKQNRIRFFSPLFHDPKIDLKSLPFASPVTNMGGFDDCGGNWIPPAGSTICFAYEGGNRYSPLYFGTTWIRNRGPDGARLFSIPVPEYEEIYRGRRGGYLCGPNNGSQVLPPWNTESYNGYDITALNDLETNPDILQRMTYPNIYGFKTPEKHMVKMVDGDARCARKWKRLEIMSGNGNWLCFKDDHLHYGGQWAHPFCANDPKRKGDTSCVVGVPNPPPQSVFDDTAGLGTIDPNETQLNIDDAPVSYGNSGIDINQKFGAQIENTPLYPKKPEDKIPASSKCWTDAKGKVIKGSPFGPVIGGDPDYQTKSKQVGTNPFFKQMSECRPYRGPQTPQNNKCDLPQTGIQLLSISGHTFVMDDSVKDPRGNMTWERGTEQFDFGCTDKFVGRTYWKSATGHMIELNDMENVDNSTQKLRNENNGIKMRSALGNEIFLCDQGQGPGCPSLASENQGIRMRTTTNHQFIMSDKGNSRKIPCRKEADENQFPREAKGNGAYIKIRTGYGLQLEMNDGSDQLLGKDQYIQLSTPQRKRNEKGDLVEDGNLFRFQDSANDSKFILRSAGDFIISSKNSMIEVVGDQEKDETTGELKFVTTADKILAVSGSGFDKFEKGKYVLSEMLYTNSETTCMILAGRDYDQEPTEKEKEEQEKAKKEGKPIPPVKKGPNVCPVLVFDASRNKIVMSDRLYASAGKTAPPANIYSMLPYQSKEELAKDIASVKK